MAKDDWLEKAVGDLAEAAAAQEASLQQQRLEEEERNSLAARNKTHHANAVRVVVAAINHTQEILGRVPDPKMVRLFDRPGRFQRAAWGWNLEMPSWSDISRSDSEDRVAFGGSSRVSESLYISYTPNTHEDSFYNREMRGEVKIPDAICMLADRRFVVEPKAVVDNHDILSATEMVGRILPTKVVVSRFIDDRNSATEVVPLFPLVAEARYADHVERVARRFAAGMLAILTRRGLSIKLT
ncbi:hypothetical protein [Micromonospora sp. AKA38]|uniref:hypothetical protein n=1 Tax=Micromonospora sp. AKA38 TaxID=2733861 RepID=UPI0022C94C1E|nr:hypothetical protein [Micromonospora sp. AKA38]GHJ17073.1 hypothetical protein TPA0908_50680 [Micromonospora sp. AKA38]